MRFMKIARLFVLFAVLMAVTALVAPLAFPAPTIAA
jgi:hypothetical protein